jgi:hypothetical protein
LFRWLDIEHHWRCSKELGKIAPPLLISILGETLEHLPDMRMSNQVKEKGCRVG